MNGFGCGMRFSQRFLSSLFVIFYSFILQFITSQHYLVIHVDQRSTYFCVKMLLQRTSSSERRSGERETSERNELRAGEKPLTCMVYFFASQMRKHVQEKGVEHRNFPEKQVQTAPKHRLDSLLSNIKMHAFYSPLITRFEMLPVEIPEAGISWRKSPTMPRESMHDTLLLMQFRSNRAQEEWIATREWQTFMNSTESEGVFRRIPHVRCASSLRGLFDPVDVLTT